MRKFFYLMMMALIISSVSLTSCSSSDDDDNNNGGNGGSTPSIKVGNQDVNFGYVYWNIDPQSGTGTEKYYQLEFYSWDFYNTNPTGTFSTFIIGFRATGSDSEAPTGTFSTYDLSGAINITQSNPEGTYIEEDETKSGDLKITKEGSTYTITIEPLYILSGEDENGNPTASTQTTLVYKGNLPKAPRQSWD